MQLLFLVIKQTCTRCVAIMLMLTVSPSGTYARPGGAGGARSGVWPA